MNAIMDGLLATFSETGRAGYDQRETLTCFTETGIQMLVTPPSTPSIFLGGGRVALNAALM